LQRLFSTFPGSWPGLGLVILRLTLGAASFGAVVDPLSAYGSTAAQWAAPVIGALAACLAVGWATPIVSALLAFATWLCGRDLAWPILLALGGGNASLTLLGPGAWSLDAWLYGRRRIRFDED
jgi:uncharacterized membrane protein YphA (DoxX/SURF4 family)